MSDELLKPPNVGGPPGTGGKLKGLKEVEVTWDEGKKDEIVAEEAGRGAYRTAELGGAGEAATLLRERVKNILSSNLSNALCLRDVGYPLHQCLMECCKSLSMARSPQDFPEGQGDLACSVPGDPSLQTWEHTTALALQHLAGLDGSRLAEFRSDPAEKEGVRVQLERFDIWDEKFDVAGIEKFFETKTIDYSGEEVRAAKQLNWKAVENSLPEGVGKLKLEEFCTLGTRGYVERFEDYLLPKELRTRLKAPKVMVEEGQWDDLAQGLISRNLCEVIPLDEVYHLEGEPVLNGLFAVGKNEYVGTLETQRLIMNLTPVNRLCRELAGDISTLPTLANFGLLTLGEEEVCLVSSEDVRCFFYLFRTPDKWHKYMAFNKILSPHLVPNKYKGRACVMAACVLPMGFANSVSIAQHVRRNVTKWANRTVEPAVGSEQEIRKDKGFPSSSSRFRIYLDNFDQLEVVDAKLAEQIKGTSSEQILAVRQTYTRLDLPRHAKKGVARELRAEVQGALVLGDKGIAIPKPQKLVQYLKLTMELLSRGECKLRELQVVCGGMVYFTGFRDFSYVL